VLSWSGNGSEEKARGIRAEQTLMMLPVRGEFQFAFIFLHQCLKATESDNVSEHDVDRLRATLRSEDSGGFISHSAIHTN
jgi:hypothetical protein